MKHHKITTTAPGKLMLFGEHSVVYDGLCLVTAVEQRMQATIELLEEEGSVLEIIAPDILTKQLTVNLAEKIALTELPREVRFVVAVVKIFFQATQTKASLRITTENEFSASFGFGSSSAVTVAVGFGLAELFQKKMSKQDLFKMCYQAVLDVQGVGSGFDLAAAIWGGTLLFQNGGKRIEPLSLQSLPLTIAYTGVKADTVPLVKQVAELKKKQPQEVETIFEKINDLVLSAKSALEKADQKKLGQLMNQNHELLVRLGVSTKAIEAQRKILMEAGLPGAKLSGAGGGDCVIAYGQLSDLESTQRQAQQQGGEILPVTVHASGVRKE